MQRGIPSEWGAARARWAQLQGALFGMVLLLFIFAPQGAWAASEAAVARVIADAAHLSLNIGPRPAGSAAEAEAARWVRGSLLTFGWSPRTIGRDTNIVACRGAGQRLFMAHIDSVPNSPGLIDNAAGVAILMEIARSSDAPDLCLGFPDAEERGLLGSARMAEGWAGDPAALELVVALDLVGQGTLGQMGLGEGWSDARLRWVHGLTQGRLRAPVVHRLYSRLLPHMERSDHAPFAARGAPSMLLFGMGEGEVFPRYHQPSDSPAVAPSPLDPEAIAETLDALLALSRAPPPPAPGPADTGLALQLGPVLLPGELLLGMLSLCGLSGIWALRRGGVAALQGAAWSLLGTAGLGLSGLALSWGLFDVLLPILAGVGLRIAPAEAERTAAAVMGMPASGWWALAPAFSALLLLQWLLVRRALRARVRGAEPAALLGAGFAGLACGLDPLLGAIFAAAALAARLHPALGAAPAVLLLRPDALRQLSFHGLVPPMAWGLALALAGLGLGARLRLGGGAEPPGPRGPSPSAADPQAPRG